MNNKGSTNLGDAMDLFSAPPANVLLRHQVLVEPRVPILAADGPNLDDVAVRVGVLQIEVDKLGTHSVEATLLS